MIENNYKKIKDILNKNGGYITRKDVNKAGINSWYLYEYVKRYGLEKNAPGFYSNNRYFVDDYYMLQKRYPKYIFNGDTALFLHLLSDRIPIDIHVAQPHGYHPRKKKNKKIIVENFSKSTNYLLGVCEIKTMFGNTIRCYDKERLICDLIKYPKKYDAETYVKALKEYTRMYLNQNKLLSYAKLLGIEDKVSNIIMILINED